MKKGFLKSIFAITLAMLMLVACGKSTSSASAPASANANSTSAAAGSADSNQELNIVLVVSLLGDKSFNDNAWSGLQKLAEAHSNVKVKAIEIGYEPSKIEPTLMEVAPKYDIVVTGTFEFAEYVQIVAPQFPETKFIHYDASVDYENLDLSNVVTIEYKANEASFLGGYLAAKMTTIEDPRLNPEKLIGVVCSVDIPVINDFLVGYIDGALAADPDMKVAISYIGSFNDVAKAKELALNQFSSGVDILFGVAGGGNMGMFDAAIEKDRLTIGVDSDQAMIFHDSRPEVSAVILSSVMKNVGESLFLTLEKELKGELVWGQGTVVGIKEGGVGLADNQYYQENVPEEIRKEIEEVYQKLANGELTVRSSYGMSTEELDKIRNSVKP